jgi:hypothetical protein
MEVSGQPNSYVTLSQTQVSGINWTEGWVGWSGHSTEDLPLLGIETLSLSCLGHALFIHYTD